jgi:cytochrome c peroxidase
MRRHLKAAALVSGLVIVGIVAGARAMQGPVASAAPVSSYMPVNEEDFRTVLARMRAAKAEIEKRQRDLLASRYDLSDRPVAGATMSRGKAIRPQMVNGMMASADGPIKTFPLRGIKDTPPYLHDGRLLTLDDTVEFFNLVLGTQLTADEKLDLVAFLRAL